MRKMLPDAGTSQSEGVTPSEPQESQQPQTQSEWVTGDVVDRVGPIEVKGEEVTLEKS